MNMSRYIETVKGHYETDEYVFFWSGPFSNWEPSTFYMMLGRSPVQFNCAEQAMMFMKAQFFNDTETGKKILEAKSPKRQKELGRLVKNYDESDWVSVREYISQEFLLRKFFQNPKLLRLLRDTGNKHLVEASPYDAVWGIKMGIDKYPAILDRSNWKGLNLLGESLMQVRQILRHEPQDLIERLESEYAKACRLLKETK